MNHETKSEGRKRRLAILVNLVAPYRLPLYAALTGDFDVVVLHGGVEPNRNWAANPISPVKTRKIWTIQIPLKKKSGIDGVTDTTYIHLTLGLPWSLVRFKPDVIVSIEMGPRTLIALLYAKLTGASLWVWWGGTVHSERNIAGWKRRLRALLARHVPRWISYGATSTEYLETLGIPGNRILQIQNCVPQENFSVVPATGTDHFDGLLRPIILAVGQLIQRKGLNKLIESCGRLGRQNHSLSLVLVGQGPDEDVLRKLAADNHIAEFYILPHQTQSALNRIYRSADVLVFPTMEDVWGLVVNEAMWAGAPVLCSKYAGCAPELVPESQIFDPTDPDSFDAALMLAINGKLKRPDRARLKSWQEVAEMIRRALVTDSFLPANTVPVDEGMADSITHSAMGPY